MDNARANCWNCGGKIVPESTTEVAVWKSWGRDAWELLLDQGTKEVAFRCAKCGKAWREKA